MVQHVFLSVFVLVRSDHRTIFCCLLLVTLTAATSGPPILHCREDAAPAQFNFSMPTWTKPTPLVIVHPDGRAMMTRYGHFRPMREGEFYDRISNVETKLDKISFTLNGVSASDAGNYICRDGSVTGRILALCGQDLHFIDVKTPHVRESGLAVRSQTFHLNCEVYVPDEAPRLGLSFSFHWFKDGQPIPDRHGRVLTFPSVQLSDQGEYTCQVTEETRGCGSSPKSFPFTLHVIIPPSVSVKSQKKRGHIEGYLDTTLTLTCVVEKAFPRVPPNGFSWTFSPSDSSPAQQLPETGDTLTLGPLTREDSGLYTCQARNDQNYQDNPRKWSSGTDSINVTVISPPLAPAVPETDRNDDRAAQFIRSNPGGRIGGSGVKDPSHHANQGKEGSGNHEASSSSSLTSSSGNDLAIALGIGVCFSILVLITVVVTIVARRRRKCCFLPPKPGRTPMNDPASNSNGADSPLQQRKENELKT